MRSARSAAVILGLAAAVGVSLVTSSANAQSYSSSGSSQSSRSNAATTGLILVVSGLALGGPGFTILAVCSEGEPCHSETTTTVGWVLAAPGIPLVAVGALFLWASSGSRSSMYSPNPLKPTPIQLTAQSIPSGGMVSARYTF